MHKRVSPNPSSPVLSPALPPTYGPGQARPGRRPPAQYPLPTHQAHVGLGPLGALAGGIQSILRAICSTRDNYPHSHLRDRASVTLRPFLARTKAVIRSALCAQATACMYNQHRRSVQPLGFIERTTTHAPPSSLREVPHLLQVPGRWGPGRTDRRPRCAEKGGTGTAVPGCARQWGVYGRAAVLKGNRAHRQGGDTPPLVHVYKQGATAQTSQRECASLVCFQPVRRCANHMTR